MVKLSYPEKRLAKGLEESINSFAELVKKCERKAEVF